VSPRAQRVQPLHRQIADDVSERISAGDEGYRPGDKLPPIRVVAREWEVGQQAAQRAYELLASSRLVEMRGTSGTFVAQPRRALGPQQRLRSDRFSGAESVEVRAAEVVPATGPYAYVRPILGLAPSVPAVKVIRREQVTTDSTGAFILSVSWLPGSYAARAPELLKLAPLPDPQGAAHLVAGRYGLRLDWGRAAREARRAKDDGREIPLLGLEPGAYVLAETYVWGAGGRVVEYGEFIVRENRVVESDLDP
jgi:DNA-binding GntR family transcriptional regulator